MVLQYGYELSTKGQAEECGRADVTTNCHSTNHSCHKKDTVVAIHFMIVTILINHNFRDPNNCHNFLKKIRPQ